MRALRELAGVSLALRSHESIYRLMGETSANGLIMFSIECAFCDLQLEAQRPELRCWYCREQYLNARMRWQLSDELRRTGQSLEACFGVLEPRSGEVYWQVPGGALIRDGGRCPLPNYFRHFAEAVSSVTRVVRGCWAEADLPKKIEAPRWNAAAQRYEVRVKGLPAGDSAADVLLLAREREDLLGDRARSLLARPHLYVRSRGPSRWECWAAEENTAAAHDTEPERLPDLWDVEDCAADGSGGEPARGSEERARIAELRANITIALKEAQSADARVAEALRSLAELASNEISFLEEELQHQGW